MIVDFPLQRVSFERLNRRKMPVDAFIGDGQLLRQPDAGTDDDLGQAPPKDDLNQFVESRTKIYSTWILERFAKLQNIKQTSKPKKTRKRRKVQQNGILQPPQAQEAATQPARTEPAPPASLSQNGQQTIGGATSSVQPPPEPAPPPDATAQLSPVAAGKRPEQPTDPPAAPVTQPANSQTATTTQPEVPPATASAPTQQKTTTPALVPLDLLERLQTVHLASEVGLQAVWVPTFAVRESTEAFAKFMSGWNNGSVPGVLREKLQGSMPYISFSRVVLEPAPGAGSAGLEGRDSLCVGGLTSRERIRQVHAVLSRKDIQAWYHPLRLCYDMRRVRERAAAGETSNVFESLDSRGPATMCGVKFSTGAHDGGVHRSTIGGLVKMNGVFMAVTSAHGATSRSTDSAESPSASAHSTNGSASLLADDYDAELVDPVIILDFPSEVTLASGIFPDEGSWQGQKLHSPGSINIPRQPQNRPQHRVQLWSDAASPVFGDWKLVPVTPNQCLPNMSLNEEFLIEADNVAGSDELKNEIFITHFTRMITQKPVRILVEPNRLSSGTLRPATSFLAFDLGPLQETCVVALAGEPLRDGDSGSWVIDARGGLIGMVRATVGRDVYVVPFWQLIELDEVSGRLQLPSALSCLLENIHYNRRNMRSLALNPKILEASARHEPPDRLAAAILHLQETSPELYDTEALTDLLVTQGSRLHAVLAGNSSLALAPTDPAAGVLKALQEAYKGLYPLGTPPGAPQTAPPGGQPKSKKYFLPSLDVLKDFSEVLRGFNSTVGVFTADMLRKSANRLRLLHDKPREPNNIHLTMAQLEDSGRAIPPLFHSSRHENDLLWEMAWQALGQVTDPTTVDEALNGTQLLDEPIPCPWSSFANNMCVIQRCGIWNTTMPN